jgi:hypothetical protein
MYDGKSTRQQRYLHLKAELEGIGVNQSQLDECVFYDIILSGPSKQLESIVRETEASGPGITNEGGKSNFLGVIVTKVDNAHHLTQPQLIQSILDELRLNQSGTKDSK